MIMNGGEFPTPGSSPDLPTPASLSTDSSLAGSSLNENGPPSCTGCGQPIQDEFILRVQGHFWHAQCLQCVVCKTSLSHSCYVRGTRVFCRVDFFRLFGANCAGCGEVIPPSDVVRCAHENVYHLTCFACVLCGSEFNTGDEFYLREDGRLMCKTDFQSLRASQQQSVHESEYSNGSSQPKKNSSNHSIRGATIPDLPDHAIEILLEAYKTCANPSHDLIQQMSAQHKLDARSVRLWFQDQRMRDQKESNSGSLQSDADTVDSPTAVRCDDEIARVVAPLGGYPLPIVNEAASPGRLSVNRRTITISELPVSLTASLPRVPCDWPLSEDFWRSDFVPPNVDLDPCDIRNGEVCDHRRGLLLLTSDIPDEGAFHYSSGRGDNHCGNPPSTSLQSETLTDAELLDKLLTTVTE